MSSSSHWKSCLDTWGRYFSLYLPWHEFQLGLPHRLPVPSLVTALQPILEMAILSHSLLLYYLHTQLIVLPITHRTPSPFPSLYLSLIFLVKFWYLFFIKFLGPLLYKNGDIQFPFLFLTLQFLPLTLVL